MPKSIRGTFISLEDMFVPLRPTVAAKQAESVLRKKATRLGYQIRKARQYQYTKFATDSSGSLLWPPIEEGRKYASTMSGGGFRMVRLADNAVVLGGECWDATLDDIDAFLRETKR